MFADELTENASKKRQEQARERRKKLKAQQQKDKLKKIKQQQQKDKNKETRANNDDNTNRKSINPNDASKVQSLFTDTSLNQPQKASSSAIDIHSSSSPTTSLAVSNAIAARRTRALQNLHQSSTLIIQSAYRAYRSNNRLLQQQRTILDKRLNDLVTLSCLLHKKNRDYLPPPSLVNLMVNQMLFVFHSTPRFKELDINHSDSRDNANENENADVYKPTTTNTESRNADSSEYKQRGIPVNRKQKTSCEYFSIISHNLTPNDAKIITQMIQYAILPGLLSNDENLDSTLVWLQSKAGRIKLKKIVRLCCHLVRARCATKSVQGKVSIAASGVSTAFIANDENLAIIYNFFTSLLQSKKRTRNADDESLSSFCRAMLFPSKIDTTELRPGGMLIGQRSITTEILDLIFLLRSFLLFPSNHRKNVIPSNAERDRDACIPRPDQKRADGLFELVSQIILEMKDEAFYSRFVVEIMPIPLLTWRIGKGVKMTFARMKSLDDGRKRDTNTEPSLPPFCHFVFAFMNYHAMNISLSHEAILGMFPTSDVPFTICPASPVLCFMANMVEFGSCCPHINGVDQSQFEPEVATAFFNIMSILVDIVPLGAFSSRHSEMEWIQQGSHLIPIVLSPVVRDQCKILLSDTFIREMFSLATANLDADATRILNKKDSMDIKLENELDEIRNVSAISVAAKEATVDRSTGFWKRSKWAKQLSKLFGGEERKAKPKGEGILMNTTCMSRDLANGKSASVQLKVRKINENVVEQKKCGIEFLIAITRTIAIILSRWGGHGVAENLNQRQRDWKQQQVADIRDPCIIPLLNVLCFATPFLRVAWSLIQSDPTIVSEKRLNPIRSLDLCTLLINDHLEFNKNFGPALLLMFNTALAHTLIVTDDSELHDLDSPLPQHQIRRCIVLLKGLLHRAYCVDTKISSDTSHYVGLSLVSSSAKLMRDLYDRSSRRILCAPKCWLITDLLEEDIRRCNTYEEYCALLETPVLRHCPFLVSFKRRLKIFERIITTNRTSIQGRNDGFSARPGVHVEIMRGRVLEDGLSNLNKLGSNLRRRIIVHYVNSAGANESGLDAGGLFKEFWTDLSSQSFDPNWALFKQTEDSSGYLYPNPSSRAAHGSDSITMFEFLGRILGKAIYEGITVRPQFAHFFLSFLRGNYNFLQMLPDLSTMDKTLYNNLMFLKTYEGNASDLCLTFAVAKDDFGSQEEVPLIPGGNNMDVTNANKHQYVGLVAKHYVCDRVKEQSEAFRRGLWDVIDRSWLRIFNEPELQVLISGPTDGKLDIDDMKANTKYTGGYTIFDSNVRHFWKVLKSLTKKQQAELLRFVTSCERPPPLGFGSMQPPFTIQRVAISSDSEKLPTASTCFNVLKLPTYSSEKVLKDRLVYAIQSGSGFELA